MISTILSLALLLIFTPAAHAKTSAKPKAAPAAEAAATPTEKKQLWSAWYTVVVANQAQGYYREEAEERPGEKQIAVDQHWWEANPPMSPNETVIGAISANDGAYRPIAFYVEKKSELSSSSFEGRAKADKFTVTMNPEGTKKSIKLPKGVIFSSQIALVIAANFRKGNFKYVDFTTIIEDPKDKDFNPKKGRFKVSHEQSTIRGLDCFMAETMLDNLAGKWWITKEGKVCKVLLPAGGAKIELVDEAEAKGFLKQ